MPEPQLSTQIKEAVARRANGCCEYCRSQARLSQARSTNKFDRPQP